MLYTQDLSTMRKEFERLMKAEGGTVNLFDATFEVEPDSCIAVTTKWAIDLSKGVAAMDSVSEPSSVLFTREFHRQHLELKSQAKNPDEVGQVQVNLAQAELTKHGLMVSPKQNYNGFSWAAQVVSGITTQKALHMIYFRADDFGHCVALDTRGPTYRFFDVNAGEASFDDAGSLSKAFHNWVWTMGFMQVGKAGAAVSRATC